MGVRPPTGRTGEPEAVEFGIAVLADEVAESDLAFPADATAVVRALDDPAVPVDARGRKVGLSTAMAEVEADRFDSERDLLNALHPVFESYRGDRSTGWLGALRRALPF